MALGDEGRLDVLERELAAPLPRPYRQFLASGATVESFQTLQPLHPEGERIARRFLREWHSLDGTLFPIEDLGEGHFACFQLASPDQEPPVVYWDVLADLGEQPFVRLADSWGDYREGRESETLDPSLVEPIAWRQRADMARELDQALGVFEAVEERFHAEYERNHPGQRFEHEHENELPRPVRWRPVRFAVQDHLLGVMAYRFDRTSNRVEVAGFATRDHTNYARGTATTALLTGLLCEWAAWAAAEIRFLRAEPISHNKPVDAGLPWEIVVLGQALGSDIRPGQSALTFEQSTRLLVAFTPLPAALRRQFIREPRHAVLPCLNVLKNVWAPFEAASLALWCPDTEAYGLFSGELQPGEQVRYAAVLWHARSALLLGFGLRVLEAQAEITETPTPTIELGTKIPYTAVAQQDELTTEWMVSCNGGRAARTVPAGMPMAIVGLPSTVGLSETVQQLEERFAGAKILLIAPKGIEPPAALPDTVYWVQSDEETAQLDAEITRRFSQSRKLRQ